MKSVNDHAERTVSPGGKNLLFSSGDPDEVAVLDVLLRHHIDVAVSPVRQGPLLVGWEELPFVDTADGHHIVGLAAIEEWLREQSSVPARG